MQSPKVKNNAEIPEPYLELTEAFCKVKAFQLPSHWHWLCSRPPAWLVASEKKSISSFHPKAMEEYIKEPLMLYTSIEISSGCRVLLHGKKYGGLCACTDYRGLNAVTLKCRYPLPLLPSELKQVKGAKIWIKRLHSAYNLIHIQKGDEWKTAFITTSGYHGYWSCLMVWLTCLLSFKPL